MPALPFAWAGLLAASLAAAPSLDAGLVVEARARTAETTGAAPERMAEAEVAPWARFGLAGAELDLAVEYRPLLTLTDVGGGARALLHQAALVGHWQRGPGWLLSAQLAARLGEINRYQLFSSGAASGDPAQPFPTVASLGFRSLVGTLGLGSTIGPRSRLQLSLSGGVEGGATVADQRWLPWQEGGRALAALEWDAGPHDVLVTALDATAAQFSSGPSVAIAGLTETWRHVASEALRTWVGAGPAVAAQRVGAVTVARLLPAAEVGVGYDGASAAGVRWKGTVAAILAPFVDRITGAAPERVGVTVALLVSPSPVWWLEGVGSAGQVVNGLQQGDQAWGGSLQVVRTLGGFFSVAVGVRGIMQRQPRYDSETLDWNAFLALDVHTRRPDKAVPDPSAVQDPLRPRAQGAPEEHE